jgi:pyruvate/2-oxoglutarate dehydrogenase complex dihydrolipoamide acyltransferase (E2) component
MSEPSGYEIEPKNKYFEATRAIVEYEIRPGNTVSFTYETDLTQIERIRASAAGGRKPSYTSFIVKAVALALKDFPYANRRVSRRLWFPWLTPRLQKFHRQDVAVAVERDFPGAESTAFMDIVRDADEKSLVTITEALAALATCDVTTNKQWREFSGVITKTPSWLATFLIRLPCFVPSLWVKWRGGPVLISSPAKYGVDVVVGTWSHPLGVSFGLVKPRPVVRSGQVVACTTFVLTMNFDRRVMAGAQAARFFRRIVERLERAETEMAPYIDIASPGRSEPDALAPSGTGAVAAPEAPAS